VEYQAKSLRGLVFGLTPEEFFNEETSEEETIEFLEGLDEPATEVKG
jgi:hypothetical protein